MQAKSGMQITLSLTQMPVLFSWTKVSEDLIPEQLKSTLHDEHRLQPSALESHTAGVSAR